jgi:hypothetical protein
MLFKKKKEVEFKIWHGILLIGILLVAIILGFVQRNQEVEEAVDVIPVILNKETCEVLEGVWNECASACRGHENIPCIQICIAQCECRVDDQCPYGFSCEDMIDGVGVCRE